MNLAENYVFALTLLIVVPTLTVLWVRYKARPINARYHADMAAIHAEGARVVAAWAKEDESA